LPSLDAVSIEGTPLAKDQTRLDALLAKLPKGTKLVREAVGPDSETGLVLRIPRASRAAWKAPKGAALVRELRDDAVPEGASLDAVDLHGQVLDGVCLAEQTLVRANLRSTRWTSCELGRMRGPKGWNASKKGPAGFDGANLEGAVFEDCVFVGTTFRGAKLRGAKFRGCRFFSVSLDGADLREAELDLFDDPSVSVRKADGAGMSFTASFAQPGYARTVVMKDVNLEDASLRFRLAPGKRPADKSNAAWDAQIKGGKRNAATTIAFGDLPVAKAPVFSFDGDDRGRKGLVELGKRVVALPAAGKSHRLGRIEVGSGCVAFVLPYEKGACRPADVQAAARGSKARVTRGGPLLVPLANGAYDVFKESVGDGADFEDELGAYEARVRIVRAGASGTGTFTGRKRTRRRA